MGLIQYYLITWQPVNQASCIFISMPIVFCNLVTIKLIIIVSLYYKRITLWLEASGLDITKQVVKIKVIKSETRFSEHNSTSYWDDARSGQ